LTVIADPPLHRDADSYADAGGEPDAGAPTGPPRWVAVVGVCLAVLVLLAIVLLHLAGTLGPGAH
jgi:hypothetical protein